MRAYAWFDLLLQAGVSQWPRDEHRRLIVTNITGYLAGLSSLSYALTYAFYDFETLKPVVFGNVLASFVYFTLPIWHRFGRVAAGVVLAVTIFASIFYFIWFLGRNTGIQLNYLGAAAIAFAVFGLHRLGLVLACVSIALALHFYAHFMFFQGQATPPPEKWFIDQLYILSAGSITLIVGIVVWYAFKLAAEAEERSERLLRNVLPDAIAERLKANPQDPIADHHDNATVLFSDIVGFMNLSRANTPEDVVNLLNQLFTAFDAVGAEVGCEKIKTIGDAYMAVAVVPHTAEENAKIAARLGIGMMDVCARVSQQTGIPLTLRIGIASGPVMAGVIGKAKFAYDVWGETVNLAARLESHGKPDHIHISDETKILLEGDFACTLAPRIQIKGVGKTRTWFLGLPANPAPR
jgi:adenylate cyclase